MAIMLVSEFPVIIIDPDEKKAERTRKILTKSMKGIALINTRCLSSRYQKINELVSDGSYQKLFYGCSENFFNEMIRRFDLKCGESTYLGKWLDISKIVRHYWNQKG